MRPALLMAAVAALFLGGCTAGLLYTRTTEPLTLNHHATPVVTNSAQGDVKHIQLNWFGVMWDRNGLGEIAREHGLKELYYADMEHLSVLTVWRQYTVHLYGR